MEESRQEKDMTPILIKDLGMEYATEHSKQKTHYGLFECQYCGKEFRAMLHLIKVGHTKSCGCIVGKHTKHKLTHHKLYGIWRNMMQRCYNEKMDSYIYYGGRGIGVCKEWHDTKNFIDWAEETYIVGMSLDRIDSNGDYMPNNCRWVDKTLQTINRRVFKNNTSGYVGVCYNKNSKKWKSYVYIHKKHIYLGLFEDKMEAVKARDDYIKEHNLPHKLSTEY